MSTGTCVPPKHGRAHSPLWPQHGQVVGRPATASPALGGTEGARTQTAQTQDPGEGGPVSGSVPGPQALVRAADGGGGLLRPGGTDRPGCSGPRGHRARGTQRGWGPKKALVGRRERSSVRRAGEWGVGGWGDGGSLLQLSLFATAALKGCEIRTLGDQMGMGTSAGA